MSDPLEHRDIAGVIQTSRHERVRYRAGSESGEVFVQGEDFDGLTLTIEVAGRDDALAMIRAIENT